MKALLLAVMTWASVNTGLPLPDRTPSVAYASYEMLADIAYTDEDGSVIPHPENNIGALYDPERQIVYLHVGWQASNLRDLSNLVHEIVHHLQQGQEYPCMGAAEPQAYETQIQFLVSAGLNREQALDMMDVNELMIVTIGACWGGQ